MQDLRYALRQLKTSPGFAITAVLTLAIGIGGVTAVFSLVQAVLLRPLPFPDSNRLVSLHESVEVDAHDLRVTAPDIITFQRENKAFSGFAGYIASAYELTGAGAPFHARAERVTASLFPVLGVNPTMGRAFTQQEDENSIPVVMISYALWKERFQSAPGVVGRTIDLDRRPFTIVGVMPRGFEFPLDAGRMSHRDIWVPMSFTSVEKQSQGTDWSYSAVARLRPGVTMLEAQQDVDRVIAAIQKQYDGHLRLHGQLMTLKDEVVNKARSLLGILLGAVALILLIACANLANLLLVRAAGRKREFGVRLALGAVRRALLRQLLTESLVLSLFGGVAGIVIAVTLVRVASANLPDSVPRLGEVGLNWPLLLASVLLIGATGVICGLAPAFQSMRTDVLDSLRDGSRTAGHGRDQHRMRSVLVTVEVALAMLLLVSSGLLLRSFAKMLAVDPGFEPARVLTASLSLPKHDYPTQQKVDGFFSELQGNLLKIPGVQSVGFSSNIPIAGQNSGRLITPEGHVRAAGEAWNIVSNYLTAADYFDAIHIPLIRGRYFTAADDQPGAPLVTVIGQSLANRYFAGKDPIGMHIKVGSQYDSPMPTMTIIGVVGDIKQGAPDEPTVAQMYEPISQAAADLGPYSPMIGVVGAANVVVRSTGDPAALESSFDKAVHQLDPLLAVTKMHTMDEVVAAVESPRRFNTMILTAFSTIALLLSLLGIYGVMAYSVKERTREIAIRMALGATRESVLLGTLRSSLILTVMGIAAGLIASAALTRLLANLLYDVKPLDGIAIASAIFVLLLCATVAGWFPARRAATVEPMEALRFE